MYEIKILKIRLLNLLALAVCGSAQRPIPSFSFANYNFKARATLRIAFDLCSLFSTSSNKLHQTHFRPGQAT